MVPMCCIFFYQSKPKNLSHQVIPVNTVICSQSIKPSDKMVKGFHNACISINIDTSIFYHEIQSLNVTDIRRDLDLCSINCVRSFPENIFQPWMILYSFTVRTTRGNIYMDINRFYFDHMYYY